MNVFVWDYNRADVDFLKHAIDQVNWRQVFSNINVYKQAEQFNSILT